MIKGLDHIAICVADLTKAERLFSGVFGLAISERFTMNMEDGTKAECVAFGAGSVKLVLAQSKDENSAISKWVRKHGNGVHHIALAVDDLDAAIAECRRSGMKFQTDEKVANDDLAQILSKPEESTGIVYELIQRKTPGKGGFASENAKRLIDALED